jgi:hypothetical protein
MKRINTLCGKDEELDVDVVLQIVTLWFKALNGSTEFSGWLNNHQQFTMKLITIRK